MKVTYPRVISIQLDGEKPVRFTDASKAAEYWARAKEDEWVEKMRENPKYTRMIVGYPSRSGSPINQIYDDGRIRYRKLKRRALRIFRQILSTDK
jgi:hypothetical protein